MNTKIKVAMAIAAAAVAASANCKATPSVNTSIWFDGSDQQVATGGDDKYEYGVCEETTMGYWYDYDDRKNDNGSSYAAYPFDTTGYYGSLVAPEIETLNYATIGYSLAVPTNQTVQYKYNFVGFGFNLVSGKQEEMDISAAAGLCATYTTDNAVTLEIASTGSGDASCNITLQKATTPTTVSKAIADFKQPTWAKSADGNLLGSCAEAFAAASAVKFKLDGGASAATGKLRIFEVGPAGTCTGKGAISADEPASFCYQSDGNGHAALVSGDDCVKGPIAIGAVKAAASVKASYANHVLSISGLRDAASYEIVSLQGQVVKSGVATSSINLASLNAGVYMVRVAGNTVNMTQKILVK